MRLLPQAGLGLTGRSRATTLVARLAPLRILLATQFAEDLIRGSLEQHQIVAVNELRLIHVTQH